MKKIAISTNKGGCLKTSLTVNIAGLLSLQGKRVLIIDSDNQGNCALSFDVLPDDFKHTLHDVLVNNLPIDDAITNIHENIDILPSNDEMTFFEFDVLPNLKLFPNPFGLLKDRLGRIENEYDYILIDTPPNLGLMQGNVLSAVDDVIIPFQPENYSMRSLVKTLNAIQSFKEKHNPDLSILGVVATMIDLRTTLHSEVLQKARRYCLEQEVNMFETVIPRTIRYASSIAYEGLPATLTAKSNNLVQGYYDLLEELQNG